MAEGLFFDVLPHFNWAASEAGVKKIVGQFDGAAKDIAKSFGGQIEGTAKKTVEGISRDVSVMQRNVETSTTAVSTAFGRMVEAQGRAEVGARRYTEAVAAAGTESSRAAAAFTQWSTATVKATAATEAHTRALAVEDAAMAKLVKGQAAHQAALDASTSKVAAFGAAANKVGMVSAAAFTGIAFETTKMAANFESSQQRLIASAGESKAALAQVSQGVLDMAGQVGYTAGELSKGLYVIESAGHHGAEGLDLLKVAAQGAKSENADLTEVAGGLATTMRDFNIPMNQAADVMSKIVAATGMSRSTFQEFSGALHSVEPLAGSLHIKLEDLFATMAQASQSGASMDQVTENMRNALNSLSGAQKPARDAMRQLGIDADDVSQHLDQRGLAGTMQYLADTIAKKMTGGLIDVGLFKQNARELDNMTESLNHMSPAARQVAEGYRAGTVGARQFQLAVRAATGDDIKRLQDFKQWSDDLNDFSKRFKNSQSTLETYNQALKDVTGTVAGQSIALQVTGENAGKTNAEITTLANTHRNADGTVKGFNETMETLNGKLSAVKAEFGATAIELGNDFLPVMKDVADGLKTTAEFLAGHKGLVEDATIAVGLFGAAWVTTKLVLAGKEIWTTLGGSIKFVIDRIALIGPTATTSAATVATAAAAEETALAGVSTAADGAAASVSRIGTAMSALSKIALPAWAAYELGKAHDAYDEEHDPGLRDAMHAAMNGDPSGMKAQFGAIDMQMKGFTGDARTPAQIREQNRQRSVGLPGGLPLPENAPGWDSEIPKPPPAPPAPEAPPAPSSSVDPGIPGTVGGAGGGKPLGSKTDPVYMAPSSEMSNALSTVGGGAGTTGETGSSILTSGFQFTPQGIAKYFTAMLADLALGNPLGKSFAGDSAGSIGADSQGLAVSADEIEHMTPQQRVGMQNTIRLQKAVRTYQKDLRKYSSEIAKHGAGSEQAQDALDTVLNARDSIDQLLASTDNKADSTAARADAAAAKYGYGSPQYQAAMSSMPSYGPGDTSPIPAGAGSAAPASGYTKDQAAATIIAQARARGLNKEQTLAALSTGILETNLGSNPMTNVAQNQNGTPGIEGLFQQEGSTYGKYGNRLDPNVAAAGFIDQFVSRGQGLNNPDPYAQAVKVQVGQYGPDYVRSFRSQAQSYYDRLVPQGGAPAAPSAAAGPSWFGQSIPTAGQGLPIKRDIPGINFDGGSGASDIGSGFPTINNGRLTPGADKPPADIGGMPVPPGMGMGGIGNAAGLSAPYGRLFGASSSASPAAPSAPKAPGPGPLQSTVSGQQYGAGQNPGSGFSSSIGGTIASIAGPALDALAPGSGEAAQQASKLIDRTIGYAGQLGGIAVGGLMETFLPGGLNNPLANPSKSWLGKAALGFAGAHHDSPDTAGTGAGSPLADAAKPDDPSKPAAGPQPAASPAPSPKPDDSAGQGADGGPTNNGVQIDKLEVNNHGTGSGSLDSTTRELNRYASGMAR